MVPRKARSPSTIRKDGYSSERVKYITNNLSKKLGTGGSGSVFKGEQHGMRLAVKRLNVEQYSDEDFDREVGVLKKIPHSHIVRIMGSCREERCIILGVYGWR